jgi:hypothetical protein
VRVLRTASAIGVFMSVCTCVWLSAPLYTRTSSMSPEKYWP